MKHAGPEALDRLEPLLVRIRALPGLTERKRGTFYRKSRAFLHFHEDPKGLFADIRIASAADFDRFDVTTRAGADALVTLAEAELKA